MNSLWFYPFIIISGALQAMGNSMNAQLKDSLQNPWLASIISFGLILIFFIAAFAVLPRPLPTVEGITSMPWWAPLGGLAGAFAVFAGLTMVSKIGSASFNGLIITANILTSLLIDHFGLLNMSVHTISVWRMVGCLLMVGGVILIAKF